MSTDDALHRIARAGYTVNNLFQRRDLQWQANVMSPDGKAHEFGVAHSPEAALHMAMLPAHKLEQAWYGLMQAVLGLTADLERHRAQARR